MCIRDRSSTGINSSSFLNPADSTDPSNGALVVSGGVGIGKKLYVGGTANVTSSLTSASISTGAITVSGSTNIGQLTVTGITKPNFISGWTSVSNNGLYTFTHNLNWTWPYVPFVRVFFSSVVSPVVGTDNIFELATSPMSGLNNQNTNYQYGIGSLNHDNSNTIVISTATNGLFYDPGGLGQGIIASGYISLLVYR